MDIKKTIKARGWTLEKLAGRMGITQPSLTSIVNGNPTLGKLKAIADCMGISVSDLLKDGEEPQSIICPHCGKAIIVSKAKDQ